ncbi:MAG: hypothetical protein GY772_22820 [bacterium]|nr:hypothetical protein [bacterium]
MALCNVDSAFAMSSAEAPFCGVADPGLSLITGDWKSCRGTMPAPASSALPAGAGGGAGGAGHALGLVTIGAGTTAAAAEGPGCSRS